MLTPSEKKAVEQYLHELTKLTAERNAIEERMQRVELAARSVLALTDNEDELMAHLERLDDILRPEGFTDAIRKVLRAADAPLTPAEVKERLASVGFYLTGYSNPSASIHTILKRLAKTEFVEATEKDGKIAYESVGLGRGVKSALLKTQYEYQPAILKGIRVPDGKKK